MINELRRNLSTYRRFNLQPIHRRAFSSLKRMDLVLAYSADKGLGPYVNPKYPNYIKQGINEHMGNNANYTRLLSQDAEEALQEQFTVFIKAFKTNEQFFCPAHKQYFTRSVKLHQSKEGSRTPKFYGLWKIHKDKPSMHPVISPCGSFPEHLY
jgi:hypothetical protein